MKGLSWGLVLGPKPESDSAGISIRLDSQGIEARGLPPRPPS